MAYEPSKLVCVTPRIGAGPALWIYNGVDAHGTVSGNNFFSNGKKAGMKVGDHVVVGKTGATEGSTIHYVKTVVDAGATLAAAILA
jgi:hypothetical protein